MPPHASDCRKKVQVLTDALGFLFQLVLGSVGILVDDLAVEAVVGAVTVDHVFVGRAVALIDVLVPRFFALIGIDGILFVFEIVVLDFVGIGRIPKKLKGR